MKKLLYLLFLSLFVFTSCEQEEEIIDVIADKKPVKITICHYNKGNDTWKTISVTEKQLQRHLDHGDFEGPCEERKTYIPDRGFEQLLINRGYDDVLDNYVLTSNISTVKELNIPSTVIPSGTWHEIFVGNLTGIEDFISLEILTSSGIVSNYDLSKNIKLKHLTIVPNGLSGGTSSVATLNLTKNLALNYLYLRSNKSLTSLDLTNNVALSYLYIEDVNFTELDLSYCTVLEEVMISDYYHTLQKLNIKNGNNTFITNFGVSSERLTCLQVDNVEWSVANWGYRDTYSTNCY